MEEEIEDLKEFTIDLTNIDELALGLEVCSKKSNMVIQEFAKLIIELEQQCKKQKEVIDKVIEYINKYESIKAYYEYIDEDGYDEYNYDEDFKKELLDILKEVSE